MTNEERKTKTNKVQLAASRRLNIDSNSGGTS